VCGLNPRLGGKIEIQPLDIGLEWFKLDNVRFGDSLLGIEKKGADEYQVTVDGETVHDGSIGQKKDVFIKEFAHIRY